MSASSREGAGVRCHFTVRDTGVGIEPERQAAIFAPFMQADASTTRIYGGTGLGLTISSRLVAMMGGRIWVESEPGEGSTFHFTVGFGLQADGRSEAPRLRDAPAIAELRALPPGSLGGSRRDRCDILLVEDNPVNQQARPACSGEEPATRSSPRTTASRLCRRWSTPASTSCSWTCRCRAWTDSRRPPGSASGRRQRASTSRGRLDRVTRCRAIAPAVSEPGWTAI